MSSFFNRIARLATFGKTKRLVGKDLDGNKYFELPPVNSGRTKRVVEYKVERDVADYTNGINRLPIQWTTWLSHTRADPPSLAELQTDRARQQRLQPMIAAIEEREREERIRQGYLAAPEEAGGVAGQIAGPSGTSRHSGLRYSLGSTGPGASRINAAPSFAPSTPEAAPFAAQPSPIPAQGGVPAASTSTPTSASPSSPPPSREQTTNRETYPIPTPTSTNVPPPAHSVDPSKYDDPAQLRKLAEEDTKRRMQSADVPTPSQAPGPAAQSSRIKPRRRGGA